MRPWPTTCSPEDLPRLLGLLERADLYLQDEVEVALHPTLTAVYARPDLAIGSVLWLVELVALARIFHVKLAGSPSSASRITPGS